MHCLDAVPVVTNIHTTVFRGACVLLAAKRFMQCIFVHINFITILSPSLYVRPPCKFFVPYKNFFKLQGILMIFHKSIHN